MKTKSLEVRWDKMFNCFRFSIFLLSDLCGSPDQGCKGTAHKKMFVSVFSGDQVISLVFKSISGVQPYEYIQYDVEVHAVIVLVRDSVPYFFTLCILLRARLSRC